MPDKIDVPKIRYNKPDILLISRIFLSLSFFPITPAPNTLAVSANTFMPTQVEKMISLSPNVCIDASDAAVITQNEITAGFSVLMIKPELKMAK